MIERTDVPAPSQLATLFKMLIGPEEEMDEVAADIVLELHGIDPATLSEDLKERLERKVAECQLGGEEVPQVMLDVLSTL